MLALRRTVAQLILRPAGAGRAQGAGMAVQIDFTQGSVLLLLSSNSLQMTKMRLSVHSSTAEQDPSPGRRAWPCLGNWLCLSFTLSPPRPQAPHVSEKGLLVKTSLCLPDFSVNMASIKDFGHHL